MPFPYNIKLASMEELDIDSDRVILSIHKGYHSKYYKLHRELRREFTPWLMFISFTL